MPKFGTNCIVQTAGNGQLRRILRQDQTQPSPPSPAQPSVAGFGFFVGCNQLLRRFWGMNVGCGGILAAPAGGGAPRSESRYNDCRWQSYLCFVPRSGKGGGVGDFELLQPSNGTPSVSPFGLPAPPLGSQGRFFPFQGRSADVPSFSWMRAAASWVAARRAFSRVSPAVPTSISRE